MGAAFFFFGGVGQSRCVLTRLQSFLSLVVPVVVGGCIQPLNSGLLWDRRISISYRGLGVSIRPIRIL